MVNVEATKAQSKKAEIKAPRRPRYKTLAASLIQSIRTGQYPIGSLLPTEAELSVHFDVSRHTVRQALQRLQQMRLVESEHGIGSRVVGKASDNRYAMVLNGFSDFWRYVQETKIDILSITEADAQDAPACPTNYPTPDRWLVIEGLRTARALPREPVGWGKTFLHPEYRSLGKRTDRTDIPLWVRIERKFNRKLTVVHQEISAVEIPGKICRLLKVPSRSIGLQIARWYVDDRNQLMEVALNLHPANRFKFSSEISMQFLGAASATANVELG